MSAYPLTYPTHVITVGGFHLCSVSELASVDRGCGVERVLQGSLHTHEPKGCAYTVKRIAHTLGS